MRRDPALSALPVVALTAGALLSEREKAIAAGMDDFLTKPFDPRQMVRVVRHQVERARGSPLPMGPGRDARSGQTGWPAIAGIDVDDVRARLDGNLELFSKVLRRFLAEFGDWREAPPLSRNAGLPEIGEAWEALARQLHKLAGSAGLLGAKAIHRLAKAAETRLQASPPDLDGIETLFAELADHLAALAASAAPHLEAAAQARAEREAAAATGVAPDLDVAALVELKAQLAGRRMVALRHYQQLAPALRATLSDDDFSHLAAAMERLDFKTALEVLERSP